jgi:hypothetical protein
MPYRIARHALHAFLERQILLVESTPVPSDLRDVVGAARDLGDEDIAAIWLGAGLATQVGLALLEEPERFVEAAPPLGAA